ncbi:MAG: NAD-dependent epimerase/dehydratase family protein [Myxococcota bacterium]
MKVLVTGIAGHLGRLVGPHLQSLGHDVIGLDRRAWPDAPKGLRLFQADIRKRPAEDVFRSERPDAVVHMATVTHLVQRSADRFRINLQGTRALVDYCKTYGVKQFIFCGRHTYYGAQPDSPLYHTEEEPPMGLHAFPELADLVAADLFAGSALWRLPKLDTAVLRFVYTLGARPQGTFGKFLRGPRVPTVLGFDPLFHFMHEQDVARAVGCAIEARLRGVFNVAGPQPVPLSVVIRESGRRAFPVPEALVNLTLGRFGLPRLPRGAVDHIKYSIVVDAEAFRRAASFEHVHGEEHTLREYATGTPVDLR